MVKGKRIIRKREREREREIKKAKGKTNISRSCWNGKNEIKISQSVNEMK